MASYSVSKIRAIEQFTERGPDCSHDTGTCPKCSRGLHLSIEVPVNGGKLEAYLKRHPKHQVKLVVMGGPKA